MSSITNLTMLSGRALEKSLDGIFLAIGDAYYEANTALKSSNAASTLSSSLSPESNAQIKSNRAQFLDNLDQLEMLIIRATEVLQRRTKQVPINDNIGAQIGPLGSMTTGEVGIVEGPSPETMLLNGEGLVPVTGNGISSEGATLSNSTPANVTGLDSASLHAVSSKDPATTTKLELPEESMNGTMQKESTANGLDASLDMFDDIDPSKAVPADALPVQFPAADELMNLDGPIDFGDMDFDNFNFDDTTQFDFGSMMED